MRIKLRSLIIFCFSALLLNGQQGITFNKFYSTSITAFNVIEIDSSYFSAMAALGPVGIFGSLKQTDLNGVQLFDKQFGPPANYTNAYSIIKDNDSTLAIGSYTANADTAYLFLLKLNLQGDTIYSSTIFPPSGFNYYGGYMIKTSDNGFLFTGSIADTGLVDGNAFILKTDSQEFMQWKKIYGGANYDGFYSSVQLPDQSYLSLGWTRSYGFGNNNNQDVYLVKTDSGGNFVWQKTFGTIDNEIGIGITATSDSCYLLSSGKYFFSSNTKKGTIIKIDSSGNVIWQNNYGGNFGNALWWAKERVNKDIIAASAHTNGSGNDDGWIINADSLGVLKWDRKFPVGNDHAYFRDVVPTTDGGILCAGFAFDTPLGGQKGWLVKLDSLGCDSAGCATFTSLNELPVALASGIKISPNPASNFISLSFPQPMFTACRIRILDVLGKQVYKQISYVEKMISLPVHSLPKGIYVVEILYDGKKEFAKFVKQ